MLSCLKHVSTILSLLNVDDKVFLVDIHIYLVSKCSSYLQLYKVDEVKATLPISRFGDKVDKVVV